jgi:hypothetical protein
MADDFGMGYALGQDSGNSGGFGNFGEGIWAVIILAILFGRGGFGGFGGMGGGCEGGCATQADVRAAVDQQTLISKLDQQTYGLADSTYALNNTLVNGFHGVDNAICTLGHQMSDCCCTTQRAIDGVNFNMAKGFCDVGNAINMQTRDIIDNQNANYRSLMDFIVQDKISTLTAENQSLKFQASQSAQNAYLVNQLRPAPVPAFNVPAPYCFSYGGGNNCCCGC